jgi:hypothetical protein
MTKLPEGISPTTQPADYRSHLLRFWAEHSEQPALTVWRFSLEDPLTAQRYGFASLQALTAGLERQVVTPPSSAP